MKIPDKYNCKLADLLKFVSQEEIFKLVFGVYPKEGERYCSPFRIDKNPECYFIMNEEGKLKFIDWACSSRSNLDCFDAIKYYYGLSNYTSVIHFIYDKFISGKESTLKPISNVTTFTKGFRKTVIGVHKQEFTDKDLEYWLQYGITKRHLEEDKIVSVDKIYINSYKKGELIINSNGEMSFADVSFISGNRKVYYPTRKKGSNRPRFISNCGKNDIGNIQNISKDKDYLIITKSHKDHRVLKNLGYTNTVYFSNEGQFPEENVILESMCIFKKIYILFDSDSTGIKAARDLTKLLSKILNGIKIVIVFITSEFNKSKDIADMFKYYGKSSCQNFLKLNIT